MASVFACWLVSVGMKLSSSLQILSGSTHQVCVCKLAPSLGTDTVRYVYTDMVITQVLTVHGHVLALKCSCNHCMFNQWGNGCVLGALSSSAHHQCPDSSAWLVGLKSLCRQLLFPRRVHPIPACLLLGERTKAMGECFEILRRVFSLGFVIELHLRESKSEEKR